MLLKIRIDRIQRQYFIYTESNRNTCPRGNSIDICQMGEIIRTRLPNDQAPFIKSGRKLDYELDVRFG